MTISMIHQPFLFDIENFIAADFDNKESAGKSVVRKINQIRRKLSPREKEFDDYLAKALREIKTVCALPVNKQHELVLTCIESCAHTTEEIMDDSHLTAAAVKDILKILTEKEQIESLPRYTVGGSANQTLIFSKRKPCSCA